MSHSSEPSIFTDPRKFRDDSYPSNAGKATESARNSKKARVMGERRNRCFSSSPWWLLRNYLDSE